MEELLKPVLFFDGITLTVLISLGVLLFGALEIGICSLIIFISVSRFLATNSWSNDHNYCYNYNKLSDKSLIKDCRSELEYVHFIKFIISIIWLVVGIACPTLGAVVVFGLSLRLTVGIPVFNASVVGLISTTSYHIALKDKLDNGKKNVIISISMR